MSSPLVGRKAKTTSTPDDRERFGTYLAELVAGEAGIDLHPDPSVLESGWAPPCASACCPDLPGAAPMISFSCSHCGMKLKVKPEFAGRTSKCPTCKTSLVVPAPD